MGFLGSKAKLTPNLDALAKQSTVFARAYANVPLTTASHATILTGTLPQFHGVNDFGVALSKDIPYLPALLRARGYHTAAFVGSIVLDPVNGMAPAFDRGFEFYDAGFHKRSGKESRHQSVQRRGREVADRAIAWLNKHSHGPFFLWVHLYDSHDPYDPPEPYKARYASLPYDGTVTYDDSAVGKLLHYLQGNGLFDGAMIAVMGDHGESLGEHGEATHGVFLYGATLHVPLVIKFPSQKTGKRVDGRVTLVDVAPTVLSQVGLRIPGEMQGRALKIAAAERPAYAESDYPNRAFGWSTLRALRSGKYLYVQAPRPELYDESADPRDEHDLAKNSGAVVRTMSAQLENLRKKTAGGGKVEKSLDPGDQQKLQSLGYVASSSAKTPVPGDTLPDPKDRIELANLLHTALFDVEDARYEQAVVKLQKILAVQPDMATAALQLGTTLVTLKRYPKAITPLRKAVDLLPESGVAHYELGIALLETKACKPAAEQFQTALTNIPTWADAHYYLGKAHACNGRNEDAINELDSALGLRPDHYGANLLRGKLLLQQADEKAAVVNLQRAVELKPSSSEARLALAEAYTKLGRDKDAQRERARAKSLKP